MAVCGAEATRNPFFLYLRFYLCDAVVGLVFFLTGVCGGVGGCVTGGAGCYCCAVSVGGVGGNFVKELRGLGVLCHCGGG